MIKAVIFDWSGVIKDAIVAHLWIVNRMFRGFGVQEISMEELRKNWKQPYMDFYNKYLPNLTLEKEQEIYKQIISHKDCPKSAAYPGVPELIKTLKEKEVLIGVVSSDFPDTVLPEIKEYGLENIFDDVIMNTHDKVEAIRGLIKKYNINPDEAFFIGDSNHEIEAGRQVGVKTIAVTWGFSKEKNLKTENPDFIVRNLKELERVVL